MNELCTLFTIGHSNHTIEDFIALLKDHNISALVDVRTQPYSQWTHQFNREILEHDLADADIGYVYMGETLGGRPADHDLYAPRQERPDYKKMAQLPAYQAGIRELVDLAQDQTVAIMCSEGDYQHCHRHLLITQTLVSDSVRVQHILPDGTCVEGTREPEQLSLFG